MSDCPQFISPELPWRPPEETHDYVLDISADLHSGDPERQADGLRRLVIEVLEKGLLDFPAAGEIGHMRDQFGVLAAVVDLSLFLVFPDLWLPEGTVRDRGKRTAVPVQ